MVEQPLAPASSPMSSENRAARVRRLWSDRPRSRFSRWSGLLLVGLAVYGWMVGGLDVSSLGSPQRRQNVARFVSEVRPFPLQGQPWDWRVAGQWAGTLMDEKGWFAAETTLAISVLAILLAELLALLLMFPAVRSLAASEPYLPAARAPGVVWGLTWGVCVAATRLVLMFLRSIPEYVWAFLLVAVLGPTAWPAVLALALHNAGVLGKLNAEIAENLETPPLGAYRGVGASRTQMALTGMLPAMFPRLLLFLFYRWETCVRESTVLGMLGIASLGFWIEDARARNHYDDMVLLIAVGALIVVLGDILSAAARRAVRRQR